MERIPTSLVHGSTQGRRVGFNRSLLADIPVSSVSQDLGSKGPRQNQGSSNLGVETLYSYEDTWVEAGEAIDS